VLDFRAMRGAPIDDVAAELAALRHVEGAGLRPVTFVPVDRSAPDEFSSYLLAREPFWTAG
jgi:hypothetical protein